MSESTAKAEVLVCLNRRFGEMQKSCSASGAEFVLAALEDAIRSDPLLSAHVLVTGSPCMGRCVYGPNVRIVGGNFWSEVKPDSLDNILTALHAFINDQE